jgi:hypothetical protein
MAEEVSTPLRDAHPNGGFVPACALPQVSASVIDYRD